MGNVKLQGHKQLESTSSIENKNITEELEGQSYNEKGLAKWSKRADTTS